MNTVLQELSEFISVMKVRQTLLNGCDIDTVHIPSLEHKISELLELEKKQIVDAYNQGFRDGESIEDTIKVKGDIANFSEAEQYYNSTFTNQ